MTPKRLHYGLIGIFIVLVGTGIGLTFYAANILKAKSNDIVTHKLDTAALEEQKNIALQAESDLKRYADTKESVERIVPKNKDQARAIAELIQIAAESGAIIKSISFPASDLGAAPAPKPAATTEDSATPTADSTTTAPAPTTPKTSSVSQAKPVEGIAGILGVDVVISQIDSAGGPSGSGILYNQMLTMLQAVERNRRTMQVRSIQIQPIRPAEGQTTYNLTLSLTIFIKP